MKKKVIVYYLEMNDPGELCPKGPLTTKVDLVQSKIPSPAFSRYLYTAVGGDWNWLDRLNWTWDQWLEYLENPHVETWVAYVSGTPAGYFEMENKDGNVEIVYLGIMPQFIGKGLGGYLLTKALERGWEMKATRVWLHTCTGDHPAALNNYKARGMKMYKQEVTFEDIPQTSVGPWPGAYKK